MDGNTFQLGNRPQGVPQPDDSSWERQRNVTASRAKFAPRVPRTESVSSR